MIVGLVAVGLVAIAQAVAFFVQDRRHERERAAWAEEREMLVNRVVARHTGEVIALDREVARRPREPRDPSEDVFVEGLS